VETISSRYRVSCARNIHQALLLVKLQSYGRQILAPTPNRITAAFGFYNMPLCKGTSQFASWLSGHQLTAQSCQLCPIFADVEQLFIEPGSLWENGYIESFNGKLRDELLNREIFTTLTEAEILIEEWRKEYNQIRPYSALHYRPPISEAIMPVIMPMGLIWKTV
jgi:putative transposase